MQTGFEYARFRVFIDSCLLLLNKEKLNVFCANKYSYKSFFDKIHSDRELKEYLEFVRKERVSSSIEGEYLYYSLEGKKKTPWDQVATIRNAMAHMQYGHFMSQESGFMLYYFLYNKDKGVRKDRGIVFEPILHKFIHMYFSNYSYGMLLKYTFFSRYSWEKRRKSIFWRYYEITYRPENMEIYDGRKSPLLSRLAQLNPDNVGAILDFVSENRDSLNIVEIPIKKAVNYFSYRKLVKKISMRGKKEYLYGVKVFLDFETVLSNFLVHIGNLNDILYEYCVYRDCKAYSRLQLEMHKKQLEIKIQALSEDEDDKLAFEIGFVYLNGMNFALRTEDDDYIKLDYGNLDVSMFRYEEEAFQNYILTNQVKENQLQNYIIERMRNAFMHGHLNAMLGRNGEVVIVCRDIYNKREEIIEVPLDQLKCFLSQDCLYCGISRETPVLLIKPGEKSPIK